MITDLSLFADQCQLFQRRGHHFVNHVLGARSMLVAMIDTLICFPFFQTSKHSDLLPK